MARAKVVKLRKPAEQRVETTAPKLEAKRTPHSRVLEPRRTPHSRVLEPGIHPGRIELQSRGAFRVRTLAGEIVSARLHEGFDAAFAEECLRDKRTVFVTQGPDGALLLGALQTSRAVSRDAHDTLRLSGKRLHLEADEGIAIQVGKSTVRLDAQGTVKIVGQKLTMDVAAVVRVLSALVELP